MYNNIKVLVIVMFFSKNKFLYRFLDIFPGYDTNTKTWLCNAERLYFSVWNAL